MAEVLTATSNLVQFTVLYEYRDGGRDTGPFRRILTWVTIMVDPGTSMLREEAMLRRFLLSRLSEECRVLAYKRVGSVHDGGTMQTGERVTKRYADEYAAEACVERDNRLAEILAERDA